MSERNDRDFPRPSFLAALSLMAGMSMARGMGTESFGLVMLVFTVGLVFGGLARQWPWLRVCSLVVCVFAAGIALQVPLNVTEAQARGAVAELESAPGSVVHVRGEILDQPRTTPRMAMVWLAPGTEIARSGKTVRVATPLPIRLPLSPDLPQRVALIAPGDQWEGMGVLFPVADAPSPGDYENWLAGRGAAAQVNAIAWDSVPAPRRTLFNRFRFSMGCLGDGLESQIKSHLSTHEGALLAAVMLGRTGSLSPAQRHAYQRTGLMHLFAVSGLHAGLVAVILAGIVGLLGFGPRGRAVVVIVGLVLFCALTGFRSSALRASLLAVVFFLQPLVRREIEPLGLLSTVAIALLLLRPRALWQLDFQFSFLCALTLVVVLPGAINIETWFGEKFSNSWRWSLLVRMVQIIFVSTCIQIALAPLVMTHMGQFSLIAPLANAFVLPVIGIIMACGYFGALVGFVVPTLGEFFLGALDFPLAAIDSIAFSLSKVPGAALASFSVPVIGMGAYYLLLLGGRWLRLRPRFTVFDGFGSGATHALVAFALLLWLPFVTPARELLTVRFLDVGQGDAILLQTREGVSMLIDAGPPRNSALSNELKRLGIEHLDLLVLTHADADHIGGAADLLNEYQPGKILVGGSLADTEVWHDLSAAVDFRDIPVSEVRRGVRFDLAPDVHVEVLHPADEFLQNGADRNDASVVMRVEAGEVAFLFTGDAEFDAEADLLRQVDSNQLLATVLKAGHHGSSSSSAMPFIAAVRPRVAVISCGRGNRYGHPHPDVLARFAELGTEVWRTDRQGTVTISTDGQRLNVYAERMAENTTLAPTAKDTHNTRVSNP